nr:unnamed protein product [Digitaria exilis]
MHGCGGASRGDPQRQHGGELPGGVEGWPPPRAVASHGGEWAERQLATTLLHLYPDGDPASPSRVASSISLSRNLLPPLSMGSPAAPAELPVPAAAGLRGSPLTPLLPAWVDLPSLRCFQPGWSSLGPHCCWPGVELPTACRHQAERHRHRASGSIVGFRG